MLDRDCIYIVINKTPLTPPLPAIKIDACTYTQMFNPYIKNKGNNIKI